MASESCQHLPEAGRIYDSSFMAFIIKHHIDSSLPFSALIYLICDSLGRLGGGGGER